MAHGFRRLTDRFGGTHGIYPILMKGNRHISPCNRLHLGNTRISVVISLSRWVLKWLLFPQLSSPLLPGCENHKTEIEAVTATFFMISEPPLPPFPHIMFSVEWVIIFWATSPISIEDMSLWNLFLEPCQTTCHSNISVLIREVTKQGLSTLHGHGCLHTTPTTSHRLGIISPTQPIHFITVEVDILYQFWVNRHVG